MGERPLLFLPTPNNQHHNNPLPSSPWSQFATQYARPPKSLLLLSVPFVGLFSDLSDPRPHNLSQPVALHEESHGSATPAPAPAALAGARDDDKFGLHALSLVSESTSVVAATTPAVLSLAPSKATGPIPSRHHPPRATPHAHPSQSKTTHPKTSAYGIVYLVFPASVSQNPVSPLLLLSGRNISRKRRPGTLGT